MFNFKSTITCCIGMTGNLSDVDQVRDDFIKEVVTRICSTIIVVVNETT